MKLKTWIETQIAAGMAVEGIENSKLSMDGFVEWTYSASRRIANRIIEENNEDPEEIVVLGLSASDMDYDGEMETTAGPGHYVTSAELQDTVHSLTQTVAEAIAAKGGASCKNPQP